MSSEHVADDGALADGAAGPCEEDGARRRPGRLVVISGPSGAGKSSIMARLLADPCLSYGASVTTRPPRTGEVDGRDYHFVDRREFLRMAREGELLEYEELFGHLYGTPRAPIEAALAEGRVFVVDVDVAGAENIAAMYPEAVTIFIMPPDEEVLRERLSARRTENAEGLARRLARAKREMGKSASYKYVVINRDLDRAVARVREIVGRLKNEMKRGAK